MSKAAYRSDFSQRAKTLNAGQDRRNARSSQRKCFQPANRLAKAKQVVAFAREHRHRLQCVIERGR
jgi:hypothetical protein